MENSEKYILNHSVNSQIQADFLIDIGKDISLRLSRTIRNDSVDGRTFLKTYGYIVLWIYGAFELTRTLSSSKNGLNNKESIDLVKDFKNRIVKIRTPFAKQELAGKHGFIKGVQSIYNIDFEKKDFIFCINNEKFEFKIIFKDFKNLMNSVLNKSLFPN